MRTSAVVLEGTTLRVGDRADTELYAGSLVVDDAPFRWELTGNCAFASDYEYGS